MIEILGGNVVCAMLFLLRRLARVGLARRIAMKLVTFFNNMSIMMTCNNDDFYLNKIHYCYMFGVVYQMH